MNIIPWIKRNKLASFLLLVTGYFIWIYFPIFYGQGLERRMERQMTGRGMMMEEMATDMAMGAPAAFKSSGFLPPIEPSATPQTGVDDRLVVQESNLSLVVKNVRESVNQITGRATQTGGYMVSSTLNQPEEAPFATVVVRVPSERLNEVLDFYRSLSIKVSSENLLGRDVTDEYLDIDTRINRIKRTQAKFEELLDQAVEFDDILRAQREVLNLQDQIDRLIGRRQYLEQTAKLAKLTIHLSTDELALPYSPTDTFRPAVVFKLSVRSMVLTLRKVVSLGIWAGVYAVVWVPALVVFVFILRSFSEGGVGRKWWIKRNT